MKSLILLPIVALAAACATVPAPFAAQGSTVEIPDGVQWEIDEYDGGERVAECHRTWS